MAAAGKADEEVADVAVGDSGTRDGTVEDYYELGAELGHGAFAHVFKAKDKETGKVVAVKRISGPKVSNKLHLEREVAILKELSRRHDGINSVLDVFGSPADKTLDLVLEFVDGGSVGPELFSRIIAKGHYTERDAVDIVRQMFEALAFIHENDVCHRDIKPENILCEELPDGKLHIKLADFGLSRFFAEGDVMQTRVGSPEYVAPEILSGTDYDSKVDCWSCGVVTYILLTGFLPFSHDDQRVLYRLIIDGKWDWEGCPRVSPRGMDFVSKLLVTNPKRRYTAADALKHSWLTSATPSMRLMKSESLKSLIPAGAAVPEGGAK